LCSPRGAFDTFAAGSATIRGMTDSAEPAATTSRRLVARFDDLEIVDNVADGRYEARLDGKAAGLIDYRPKDGWIIFDHTEVFPEFEGRGVGSRLAKAALDDVRARSLKLNPQCPFVTSYIKRHPEYRDLVVGKRGPRPTAEA
jgi:predicted GNAT family acetyltransferase